MCSIFGMFGLQPGDDVPALRRQALELSQTQRHRGPDWSGVHHDAGAILVHERLAIVDPAGGSQPLRSADGGLVLAVNGEIYNHRELKAALASDYAFQTGSDCEVINALYREDQPASFLNRLNGIFAFALWDAAAGRALVARDPIGVVPLYWGHDRAGRLCVASEMKALAPICADVAQFPPGHWYDTASGELLLLNHYRYTVHDWCWEIPAGGIKEGRPPLDVAREELREETGGVAESWEYVGQFYTSNEYEIDSLTSYPGEILELGRSCVDPIYRSGATMQLLWRGIAHYLERHGLTLMLGCGRAHSGPSPEKVLPPWYSQHPADGRRPARVSPSTAQVGKQSGQVCPWQLFYQQRSRRAH